VNGRHLQAFLWLRWRLRVNQMRRGGVLNAVLFALVAIGLLILSAGLFLTFLLVAALALPPAPAWVVLLIWDGLVLAFLFFWSLGLIVDLQRSEALSLDKFLHLPVSPAGAFLINYVSSLFSVNLILFLPAMVGLSLGLVVAKGPAALLGLPLLAAFLLAVTALTYQFQGWLAALMVNKRRRRTVIVLVTATFVLLCQLPNLVNIIQPWKNEREDTAAVHLREQQTELERARSAGEITPEQYKQRLEEIQNEHRAEVAASEQQTLERMEGILHVANLALPPGWLPLGSAAAAEGNIVPALLGTLGLGLIGGASLWRAYRTTMRLYTGQLSGGRKRAPASKPAAAPAKSTARFLERNLPGLSEPAQAIALGGFRSFLRAPEAKMMLLSPAILVLVFGSLLLTRSGQLPDMVRPLMAFGGMGVILFGMIQVAGNQFGFDRSGFRVFVLCAAPRRDILLGKNLALAPLALGLGLVMLVLLQLLYPLRLGDFLATLPQLISMYLVFCVLTNWLSILAPMHVPAGSFKPPNPKLVPLFMQMACIFLLPVAMAPLLIPLGVEVALEELGWVRGLPVCLVLSLLECLVVVYVYRLLLPVQGRVLQAREQKILTVVTTRD
jgi:hypothetical protein